MAWLGMAWLGTARHGLIWPKVTQTHPVRAMRAQKDFGMVSVQQTYIAWVPASEVMSLAIGLDS